ncbi:hypothetical protein ABFS82_12G086500 [Erythranthe guttata]
MVSGALKSLSVGGSIPDSKGEMVTNAGTTEAPKVNKGKAGPEPIIIPIILKMAEFDHKALLEEWVSARSSDKYPIQGNNKLIGNLKTIQDYLCSFKSQAIINAQVIHDKRLVVFVGVLLSKVPHHIRFTWSL